MAPAEGCQALQGSLPGCIWDAALGCKRLQTSERQPVVSRRLLWAGRVLLEAARHCRAPSLAATGTLLLAASSCSQGCFRHQLWPSLMLQCSPALC